MKIKIVHADVVDSGRFYFEAFSVAEDTFYPIMDNICTKLEQKSLVIDGLGKPDLRSGRSPLDAKPDRD